MKFFRYSNVHFHGIIHAILFTIWSYSLRKSLAGGVRFLQKEALEEYFWVFNTLISFVYLFFAIYQYTIASKENTLLTNFHCGVVLSFIHPFVYAFFVRVVDFGQVSFVGVSISYIVSLMIMSIPVALLVFFYRKESIKEEENKHSDILDEEVF